MRNEAVAYSAVNKGFRSIGFQLPLNGYQVIIVLDMVFSCILGSFMVFRCLEGVEKVVVGVGFFGLFSLVFYYWVRTSVRDPTDPVVLANRIAILNNTQFDSSRYQNMCTICNTSVGNNSKHCGTCNRCVQNFDHHCIWLNNCIGYNNYRLFIKLITSLSSFELITIALSSKLLKDYKDENLHCDTNLNNLGIIIFLLTQSSSIFLFLSNLIILHLWLYKQGLTTYEFIKRKKNKKQKIRPNLANDAGITGLE